MQHASLVAFLSGAVKPEDFMTEIEQEVADFYADLRETKHGFIDISDGPLFEMTRASARRLLLAIESQKISPEAAVYVADWIVASHNIEIADEATRDVIAFIEDDSHRFTNHNGDLWTRHEILDVLASLD